MLHYLENEYAKYWLKDGILHIVYQENVYIDLQASVLIVKDRLRLHQGRSLPVLCDVRGIKKIDKSARDYLSAEGVVLIKALVFITTDSAISKVMSTFYLKSNIPPVPTKAFDKTSKGLTFLNNFSSI